MPRNQLKNTIISTQDNIPLPKFSKLTIVEPEKWNVAVEQDKNFKIVIINMFKIFKEDIYKSLAKVCENINTGMK